MLHLECFTGEGQHTRETLFYTRNFCLIAAASGGIYEWLFGMWHTACCITGGGQHAREALLCTRNLEGPSFLLIAAALGGIYEWLGMWHTACCITGGGQHARETLLCTRNLEGPSFHLIAAASGGIYEWLFGMWHTACCIAYLLVPLCAICIFPHKQQSMEVYPVEDELSSNLTIVVNLFNCCGIEAL